MVPADAEALKMWFGLDEVYTYWGYPPGKGDHPKMDRTV